MASKEELRRHIIPNETGNIEDKCNSKFFELAPHQLFVNNFLSFQTPYNSLLLYHGLGSGKTCSAITICEEYRMTTMNLNKDH